MVEHQRGTIERGEYVAIGTLERADWQAGQQKQWSPAEAVEHTWVFKDHWKFEITGGWQLAENSE
jgi:hypothetical protein